jgi:hypothetical protein
VEKKLRAKRKRDREEREEIQPQILKISTLLFSLSVSLCDSVSVSLSLYDSVTM